VGQPETWNYIIGIRVKKKDTKYGPGLQHDLKKKLPNVIFFVGNVIRTFMRKRTLKKKIKKMNSEIIRIAQLVKIKESQWSFFCPLGGVDGNSDLNCSKESCPLPNKKPMYLGCVFSGKGKEDILLEVDKALNKFSKDDIELAVFEYDLYKLTENESILKEL
jgi:hypothetical protein